MSDRERKTGPVGNQERRDPNATKRIGQRVAVAGALLIAALTLMPEPPDPNGDAPVSVFCLVCGDLAAMDMILNVALFVPFGFGLRMAGLSRRRAQLVAMAVSTTVELLQLTVIIGRDGTLGDIVTNSIGAAIGILLADSWRRMVFPAPRTCRTLRILGGTGWLGVWALSALLSGRALPGAIWFGQVPSQGVYREDFPGKVLGATLNGVALRDGPTPNSAELRRRVMRDGDRLEATAVLGKATVYPASIVAVLDERKEEILVLGQDGTDLIFRVLSQAPAFGLRATTIRIPGVLAASGDTVRLAAEFKETRYSLHAVTGRGPAERSVPVSPSWGWSLLLPFEYALGPEAVMLTALWIAGLLAPLAYWAARESPRPIGAVAFLVVVVCLGLAVVPYLAGQSPVHWSEWAAASCGIALGLLLGRRSEPRRTDGAYAV